MRQAATLVLFATLGCKSGEAPAARPQQAQPTPTKGSTAATDPWAVPAGSRSSAGSSEDVPNWIHDPPAVLRDKINGVNAQVVVLTAQLTFAEYRDAMKIAEHTPHVTAVEPFILIEGQIGKGSAAPIDVEVKAVDPARVDRVLTIGKHMVTGTLASLAKGDPAPIALGDGLAHTLGAKIGDDVMVTLPADRDPLLVDTPADNPKARTKTFRVAALFHMEFDQYDDHMAVTALPAGQALVGRGDQVMGIEMAVEDVERAGDVAKAVEKALGGPPYQAMDWYELNKQLFTAMYGDKRP